MSLKLVIKKSLADFFSAKFLAISTLPVVLVFIIVFGSYTYLGGDFFASIESSLQHSENSVINYILSIGAVAWMVSTFLYLVVGVVLVLMSVILSIIMIGFFTPIIVKEIRKKHYSHIELTNQDFTFVSSIFIYLKVFFIFFSLLFFIVPFLLIPGVNLAILYLPFYYLFHNFLVLDTGSSIMSKKEFKKCIKENKTLFRTTTLGMFLLSMIPFVGILFQVFFVIVLAHLFFMKKSLN